MKLPKYQCITVVHAACIIAFNGSNAICANPSREADGEDITVALGDGWIGQNSPKLGDYLIRDNAGYKLVARREFEANFNLLHEYDEDIDGIIEPVDGEDTPVVIEEIELEDTPEDLG